VSASVVSTSQIRIAWTDTNAGDATYDVERAPLGGAFQVIADLPAGSTSYLDSQVSGGAIYEYMIIATTAANVPAVSQIVLASTATIQLVASPNSSGSLTLSWNDPSGGTANFVVEESVEGTYFNSPLQTIATLDPDTTSYTSSVLTDLSQEQYNFQVFAQLGSDPTRLPLWVSPTSNIVTLGQRNGTGGGGGGEVIAPGILGVVEVQHAKKKVSAVTIAFNEAMVSGSISNSALYHLFGGMLKRRRIVFSKKIKVGAVSYDDATDSVRVTLAKPYKGQVQISVDGTIEASNGKSSDAAFSEDLR
jgi:hypothetical protein